MSNCTPRNTPVAKGDKFSLHQCPKNELKKKDMERFPYASAVGSLMYAQVCTCPDIAYSVGMLSRYLSNPVGDLLQATSSCWLEKQFHGKVLNNTYCFLHHGGRIHSLLRGIKPWDMAVEFYHSIVNC
ncbi:Retrovirus-related Pol polyprotein from transposon TNT 1-94 [Vitis vinifera]|uniref:Retrovirus-related Pol polyprotein from transposon TNT 1-94 n=1 Tax=Vitis vinifera TaxID=29760 RepID=A0A438CAU4_VITVI|nr:Retrovirus-related Pol polyprotein from transposon TNT 1-94 [Vitis vinifera]